MNCMVLFTRDLIGFKVTPKLVIRHVASIKPMTGYGKTCCPMMVMPAIVLDHRIYFLRKPSIDKVIIKANDSWASSGNRYAAPPM